MPGMVRRSARMSTLLALTLCAGCTTVSADQVVGQRQCSRYVKLFLERTEHARPPADDSSREWVSFGVAAAGQLELANKDKELALRMLEMCEAEGAAALERARQALRPWWRR